MTTAPPPIRTSLLNPLVQPTWGDLVPASTGGGPWSSFKATLLQRRRFAATVSIASAGTIDAGNQFSKYITVTGSTKITSLGAGVNSEVELYIQDGLTIGNGAALLTGIGSDMVIPAGTFLRVRSDGSANWIIVAIAGYLDSHGLPCFFDNGTVAAGAVTVNRAKGPVQRVQLSGASALTISNWTATGTHDEIFLEVVNGGLGALTLPTGGTWDNGIAPKLQSAGTDWIRGWTRSGGTVTHWHILNQNQVDGIPIGANGASTGAFTTLSATGAVSMSPASANVVISPTGTGAVTMSPATAGTINNMSIGQTTAAAGSFTTLSVSGALSFAPANANVTLAPTGTGRVIISSATTGAMDNMVIGGTTPAAGSFTTLSVTGALAFTPANANITLSPTGTGEVIIGPATAGTINNMSVGQTTALAGSFTTLSASAAVTLSPASANVTISPTGSGFVTISGNNGAINFMSIGQAGASTGAFTTLSASAAVTLSPAGANVVISPTGTGFVTIRPATVGTMDNMSIGGVTPKSATFNGLTITSGTTLFSDGSAWNSTGLVVTTGTKQAMFNGTYAGAQTAPVLVNVQGTVGALATFVSATASTKHIIFENSNGAVGSISTSASATAFTTSSDRRLKRDFKPLDGRAVVMALKLYDYEWTNGGRGAGVIADEAAIIVPDAITGEKDEVADIGVHVDASGKVLSPRCFNPGTLAKGHKWKKTGTAPVYQGADYSKFVPYLLAHIQNLETRLATIESKKN